MVDLSLVLLESQTVERPQLAELVFDLINICLLINIISGTMHYKIFNVMKWTQKCSKSTPLHSHNPIYIYICTICSSTLHSNV